jgi:hypothetical protein
MPSDWRQAGVYRGEPGIRLVGLRSRPGASDGVARALLYGSNVNPDKLIAVRHLRAGGRLIPVHFFRNDGGSVAGRCVLSAQDTPIIDGPNPDAVLDLVRDVIDGLLLARKTS